MLGTGLEEEGEIKHLSFDFNLCTLLRVPTWDLMLCFFFFFCRRGLIMGLWNSHTSVGNILGSAIAGIWASGQW